MAFYYIDFENVHNPGLEGVEHLGKRDKVFVIYNEKFKPKLPLEIMERLEESEAEVEFVAAEGGIKHALDFQLVGLMFRKIRKGQQIHIVSKDLGYKAVFKLASQYGATVELINSIREDPDLAIREITPEEKWKNINDLFGQNASIPYLLNMASYMKIGKRGRRIANLIYQRTKVLPTSEAISKINFGLQSTESKSEFYRYCQREFGQSIGTELYRILRPIYDQLVVISVTGGDSSWMKNWFSPFLVTNTTESDVLRKSM